VQSQENILSNFGLFFSCGSSKVVKVNLHPFVALLVDRMILVTELLASNTIRNRLGLGGSTVLVRAANVQRIDATDALVPVRNRSVRTTRQLESKNGKGGTKETRYLA